VASGQPETITFEIIAMLSRKLNDISS